MKRFLIRVSAFLAPLLILAVVAETCAWLVPNTYRAKDEGLRSRCRDVETLILGNSHAYYGLRPSEMSHPAFNLANVSQVLPVDLALLRQYAPMCPRLGCVVVNIDNSNLFDAPLEAGDEAFRCTYYERYMHLGRHPLSLRYRLELLDFDALRMKLSEVWRGGAAGCDSTGWGRGYDAVSRDTSVAVAELARQTLLRHTLRDGSALEVNRRAALEIGAFCRDRGLRLFVVATPVTREYERGIPASQKSALQDVYRTLSESYSTTIIDASAASGFVDAADAFFDADHLSDAGASAFTRYIDGVIWK